MATAARKSSIAPNDLEAYWMPFTANRAFKKAPRLIARAKDMHYVTTDGRKLIDGTAGLWCCNAGHNRAPIVAAIQEQAAELDYAPAFQSGHPKSFELASRIAALLALKFYAAAVPWLAGHGGCGDLRARGFAPARDLAIKTRQDCSRRAQLLNSLVQGWKRPDAKQKCA